MGLWDHYKDVVVEFVVGRPEIARVRGGMLDRGGYEGGAVSAIFPLFGFVLLWLMRRSGSPCKRILRYGQAVEGHIVKTEAEGTSAGVVHLRFRLDDTDIDARYKVYDDARCMGSAQRRTGESVTILIDPKEPRDVVPLDFL